MTWTAVAPLNPGCENLALATAPAPSPATGLALYAIGGDSGSGLPAISQTQVYTPGPGPGTWAAGPPVPGQPRTQLAAATLAGLVHVIGGTFVGPNPSGLATHNIFNPSSGLWTAATGLATARTGHAVVAAPDGYIYAIGGMSTTNTALNTVERYDPGSNHWSAVASMHYPRWGLAACVLGNAIYVIGGQDPANQALTAVEVFDTGAQSWWTAPVAQSLPVARAWLGVSAGPGGVVYAIGGLDSTGAPAAGVYSWDGSMTSTWQAQPGLSQTTAALAAALGPDGRLYAVGGTQVAGAATVTADVEVFPTTAAQPQPYIGDGSYQSGDVILVDPDTNMRVPLGGPPTGRWDTLLVPNKDYNLSANIHNDTGVDAPDTIVRFWSFPGGVGTAGTLLSKVVVTVPAGGTTSPVLSTASFHSAGPGQHRCAVVSVSNALAPSINVDATSAAQVPDPTIPHPTGSHDYASAWRNTDSMLLMPGHIWHLPFFAGTWIKGPLPVKIEVTAAKVPLRFEETGEAAKLLEDLRVLGAAPPKPLFLAPRVRAGLEPAHELEISVSAHDSKEFERLAHGERRELRTSHRDPAHFTVRGRIPHDAKPGEAFLVDVAAHHAEGEGRPARTVRWLEVLYVTDRLVSGKGGGD